jgi:hypothetical protein
MCQTVRFTEFKRLIFNGPTDKCDLSLIQSNLIFYFACIYLLCLLYTSDAADELDGVVLGGGRGI